jgi:hypothetical protein
MQFRLVCLYLYLIYGPSHIHTEARFGDLWPLGGLWLWLWLFKGQLFCGIVFDGGRDGRGCGVELHNTIILFWPFMPDLAI